MAYIGVSPSNGVRTVFDYTATAGQTSFSGSDNNSQTLSYTDSAYIDVYQNGVLLIPSDYTATTGTSVVLDTGATVSDSVQIVVYDVFSVADTVSKANGGTFESNISIGGTLGVTGATTLTGGVSGNTTFSGEIITSTSGTSNLRIGENAGDAIQSGGNYNTVVGDEAGTAITTADNNTAVGFEAGKAITTNGKNTYIGYQAGLANAGDQNVFIGHSAGSAITDGDKNTIIGKYDGNSDGLDIRTSDNNIVLSDGDGNVQLAIHGDGNVSMGDQKTRFTSSATLNVDQLGSGFPLLCHRDGTGDGVQISFRNDNGQVGRINTSGSATSYVTSSDYRLKENVVDMTGAIDRVKQLSPKRFNFIADADTTVDGFIAHEAQAIIPEAITGEKDAVDADGNIEAQGIDQSKLVPLLTGALKEAIERIETLETKVKALEGNK